MAALRHVDDISEGIRMALEAPSDVVAGEVFNLGGDDGNYTKRMIVEAALDALGGEGTVRWVEGGVDARNYRVSFDKIKDVLGFEPRRTVPGRSRTSPRRSAPASSMPPPTPTERRPLLQRQLRRSEPRRGKRRRGRGLSR